MILKARNAATISNPPQLPPAPETMPPLAGSPPSSPEGSGSADSIRVSVRFRPLNRTESKALSGGGDGTNGDAFAGHAWRVHPPPSVADDDDPPGGPSLPAVSQRGCPPVLGQTRFRFDAAFDPSRETCDVYDGVCRSVVDGALAGIDGTVFAYGQTGSGKTYTMQGGDDRAEDGVIQMAARQLFDYVASRADREFLFRTSFIEIYNEVVRDLLVGGGGGKGKGKGKGPGGADPPPLTVREDPKRGGVYVNCHEVVVTDFASLMDTLYSGERNRVVATTEMNARSSRSHAIFRITIESREKRDGESIGSSVHSWSGDDDDGDDDRAVLVSTLNLVDLAGSESVRHTGATGKRQREGGKINQSLLTLSQVINSLSQPPSKRPQHINYRNSKLTRILQPALSGNARMAVLCCASPSSLYIEETRSTLKFAARAKMVHLKAKKNEVLDDRALIRRLQKQLADARKALELAEKREREAGAQAPPPAAPAAATADAGGGAENSAISEREKLLRLRSMILRGGTLFGGGGGGGGGNTQARRNMFERSRTSRAPLSASLNVATGENVRAPPLPFSRSTFSPSGGSGEGGPPAAGGGGGGGGRGRPFMGKRHSVGVLQIAHHNDADVLLQIYEEDSDSDDSGSVGCRPELMPPLLSPVKERDEMKLDVMSPKAAPPSPSKCSSKFDVANGRRRSSSEIDILRVALSAKSETVRSLQTRLRASEDRAESLQSQLEDALAAKTEAVRSLQRRLGASEDHAKSLQSKLEDALAALSNDAMWTKFRSYALMVVLSSALAFFLQGDWRRLEDATSQNA